MTGEGFGIAIRVRFPPLEDSGLVMRVLDNRTQRLVAIPALSAAHGMGAPLPPAVRELIEFLATDYAQLRLAEKGYEGKLEETRQAVLATIASGKNGYCPIYTVINCY